MHIIPTVLVLSAGENLCLDCETHSHFSQGYNGRIVVVGSPKNTNWNFMGLLSIFTKAVFATIL